MKNGPGPALFALLALAALGAPRSASACSVCRCGDPTFNALGTSIFERGQLRFALDFERLEKSQGSQGSHGSEIAEALPSSFVAGGLVAAPLPHGDEEHGGFEELVEDRVVATLSYAPFERLEVVGRLPWSARELSEEGESEEASGPGDPELYALFRVWSSELEAGLGRRAWLSLFGGVKTGWGENELEEGGERLDEHLQSGTGSTDPFVGLSGVRLLDTASTIYGSLQYREPGRNDHGYRYGAASFLNLGYERKFGGRFDATVELNLRDAARDEIDAGGEVDPDTGGAIAFATPRLLVDLGRNVVLRFAVQVPVWDDLDGEQEEKTVVNVGITSTF